MKKWILVWAATASSLTFGSELESQETCLENALRDYASTILAAHSVFESKSRTCQRVGANGLGIDSVQLCVDAAFEELEQSTTRANANLVMTKKACLQ